MFPFCKKILKSTFLLSSLCLSVAMQVRAEQSYFDINETPTGIEMKYRWEDYYGTQRNLEFVLDKKTISEQYSTNLIYRPEIAQRFVFIELQRAAQKINPKEARVKFMRRGSDVSFQVSSRSNDLVNKWMNELNIAKESAFDRYLAENYYSRYESPYGQKGVKPDHKRFVSESVTALLPAAQALYEQLDEDSTSRAYVNVILSWVQSIPYNTLENRLTSNGAGYLPPSEVILTNKGDCDSKTALTAALLRSLLPNLHMAIIYLPEHALLGANLPYVEGEEKIIDGGIDYLLLDPTGPRLMKVGEISDKNARYIAGEMYRMEKLPGLLD